MEKVLLAHSFYLCRDQKQFTKMRPYPPLALLYAAAALREQGYAVVLYDATFAEGVGSFVRALEQHRPRYVVLCEDSFHFVIKMCLAGMRDAALCMIEAACEQGAEVLVAGPDATDHPAAYLAEGAACVLLGESDHTLVEALNVLSGRDPRPLDTIPGLAIPALSSENSSGGVRKTPPRMPERDLSVFPTPAWDLLNVEPYRTAWRANHGYFSLNMVSTRGCPYHCNWCAKPTWGQWYAMRVPADVAEEMALLKRTHRPDHLWFADDIFGLRPAWVEEFAHEVEARDAAIPFMIQTRVDRMTEQAVAGLKRAGCGEVWLGVESGSQKILDVMEKGFSVEEVGPVRARLKAAGIKACYFLQFGYPGEAFEDIMATVRLVRNTLPDNIGISVSYPLPGTTFYTRVQEQLGRKTQWTDSGDLAMMFQGTYQSGFYRHLHRLLHRDLELRQSLLAEGTAAGLEALDALNADWLELGRLEATHRNEAPTHLDAVAIPPAAPDLTRNHAVWNIPQA